MSIVVAVDYLIKCAIYNMSKDFDRDLFVNVDVKSYANLRDFL